MSRGRRGREGEREREAITTSRLLQVGSNEKGRGGRREGGEGGREGELMDHVMADQELGYILPTNQR